MLSDAAQQLTATLNPHHHQKQLNHSRQLQRPLQIQRQLSLQTARSVLAESDRAIEGEGASILHAGHVCVGLCRQMQQLHEEEMEVMREEFAEKEKDYQLKIAEL